MKIFKRELKDPLEDKVKQYDDEIWGFWEPGLNGSPPKFIELPKRPLILAGLRPPVRVELPNGTLRMVVFKVKGVDK